MKDDGFIEIYRAEHAPQAHMIRERLEEEGIPARVDGDYLQGALGGLPLGWSSAARVLVPESDAAAAQKILAELERGSQREGAGDLEDEGYDAT